MKTKRRGDDTMKQGIAFLTVIALIVSCAALCAAVAIAGDVNSDGAVNMKDVLALRSYLADSQTAISAAGADGNGDGAVNMKDVLWLRRYLAQTSPTTAKTTTSTAKTTVKTTAKTTAPLPSAEDELRGVWISYYEVAALLKSTPEATKTALDTAFDTCKASGINTVFFHVRAYSDAYYNSAVFPIVPAVKTLLSKGFDPLTYAVEAAHSRGIALHAWVNPYRVGDGKNAVCTDTFVFGGKTYYSPASETARKAILSGIEEILTNYAVDGIHFDDYFYPNGVPTTAQAYDIGYTAAAGSLAAWRRAQVTNLVKRAYTLTHKTRPTARFGISPTGNAETNKTALYADVETWLKTAGCVDYLCPQIYYGFQNSAAPFADTVTQWNRFSRASGVKLYIGLAAYKAGLLTDTWAGSGKTEWANGGDILARQVKTLRAQKGVSGFSLFSYGYVTGAAFDSTCDKTVAQTEMQNLKKELLT